MLVSGEITRVTASYGSRYEVDGATLSFERVGSKSATVQPCDGSRWFGSRELTRQKRMDFASKVLAKASAFRYHFVQPDIADKSKG